MGDGGIGDIDVVTFSEKALDVQSLLYEVATAGISMSDPRIRYVEIQIDKKIFNEILKMFGLEEV